MTNLLSAREIAYRSRYADISTANIPQAAALPHMGTMCPVTPLPATKTVIPPRPGSHRAPNTRVLPPLDGQPVQIQQTHQRLPIDRQGRPYLIVRNHDIDTCALIDEAVERFRQLTGHNPEEIVVICPTRCMEMMMIHKATMYMPRSDQSAMPIPFVYESSVSSDYDIKVR